MNYRILAKLACRFFAISILVSVFNRTTGILWAMFSLGLYGDRKNGLVSLYSNMAPAVLLLALALLLWFGADRLSRIMTGGDDFAHEIAQIDYKKLGSIVFAVLGLVIILNALSSFSLYIIQLLSVYATSPERAREMIALNILISFGMEAGKLVLGVLLVFKNKFVVERIGVIDGAGVTQDPGLLESLDPYTEGRNVLQIGSKTLEFSLWASKYAAAITVIDSSLDRLNKKASISIPDNLQLREMEAVNLMFNAESFDSVICYGALSQILESINRVIPEMHRVLKPEGYMMFAALNKLDRSILTSIEKNAPAICALELIDKHTSNPYSYLVFRKN